MDQTNALDANSRASLTAVSNADGKTIVRLWADPVTHRLLTDASGAHGTGTWYSLTGVIDGVNVTYTLPVSPGSDILVFLGRQPQMNPEDFSLSGNTVTYTSAPDASLNGQPHKAFVIS